MKTEKNILAAFLLNLTFAVLECIGGLITGSTAILSDALHDIGDAAGIGAAFLLEKKSRKQPDETYTYGYARYSVLGGAVTTLILLLGSAAVMFHAVLRLIRPAEVHSGGMILLAVIGVCVNTAAAFLTRSGDSLNQKAVNLHMMEDVLGWIAVLVGAVIMKYTDLTVLDPLMAIGIAVFIFINAVSSLRSILDLFLEKTPPGTDIRSLKEHLCGIDGVCGVHHVHIRSMDGHGHYAEMHIVADGDPHTVKEKVRAELREQGIGHVTLELETADEICGEEHCGAQAPLPHHHHHHHHHSSP